MRLSIQIEFDKILDLETNKTSVVVGRSPSSDLVIQHESISRKHCLIEKDKGRFYITDLGSTNGVSLDGKRLSPNKRTPFLPSVNHLMLGGLDCDVADLQASKEEATQEKIVSATTAPSGDYTATIRLARLDIKRELKNLPNRQAPADIKLELESKKAKKTRNPVSASFKMEEPKESRLPGLRLVVLLLTVLALVVLIYWYMGNKQAL